MDGVSLRIAGIQHKSGIGAWTLPQARTVRISKDTTRERKVRGKPEWPYDFVAIIVISFALSVGFHTINAIYTMTCYLRIPRWNGICRTWNPTSC
jgi:hypothetical protein